MSGGRNSRGLADREFRVVAACCHHAFRTSSAPVTLLPDQLDWTLFLRIAEFHRVEGLVWNALAAHRSALPAHVADRLQAAATKIAADNLHAAQECRKLSLAFAEAKLPMLVLKGLPLGALAYGNAPIKSSVDIDLLVDRVNLSEVALILSRHGYRLVAPASTRRLERWHRAWKESVWRKDRTQIDLHTRTSDNPRLIPSISVHSRHREVPIGDGIMLRTLGDEEQFAYLAVHGASSAWFRLKWVADFAGFLAVKNASTIEQLYRRSQSLKAGRAAGQALLLADAIFGTLRETPGLADELKSDARTWRLFRTALRLLMQAPSEPTDKRWGTLPIHLSQLFLLPGLAYPLSEIGRQGRQLLNRP